MGVSPEPSSAVRLEQEDESVSSLVRCLTGLLVTDDLCLGDMPCASFVSDLEEAAGHLLRLFELDGESDIE